MSFQILLSLRAMGGPAPCNAARFPRAKHVLDVSAVVFQPFTLYLLYRERHSAALDMDVPRRIDVYPFPVLV